MSLFRREICCKSKESKLQGEVASIGADSSTSAGKTSRDFDHRKRQFHRCHGLARDPPAPIPVSWIFLWLSIHVSFTMTKGNVSTRLNPLRLNTINHLRVRRPNQHEQNACVTVMSTMLST